MSDVREGSTEAVLTGPRRYLGDIERVRFISGRGEGRRTIRISLLHDLIQ